MEFEAEERDEQHERTLRGVAYAISALTTAAAMFILPTGLAWVGGTALPMWAFGAVFLLTIWLTPEVMFRAATRVLLGRAERLFPQSNWRETWPSTLWILVAFPTIWMVTPLLQARYGGSADLPLYLLVFLPLFVPSAWRRSRSGRALWPTARPFVYAFTGIFIASGVVFGIVSQLPTQWFWWSLAVQGVLMVLLLPVAAMAGIALGTVLNLRGVLVPGAAGDFATAAAVARDTPDLGDDLAASLWMEQGDFGQTRELLDGLEQPTPLSQYLEAVLLDEEGEPDTAWERMRAIWSEHRQPPEVMIVAQGLGVGADALDLLEEMDAQRSELDTWLLRMLGMDPSPCYAACRAWALAAQGREQDARAALPAITDLPPVLATERDYLYGRALHALGDPEWRGFVERAAQGVGRAARLSERFLRVEELRHSGHLLSGLCQQPQSDHR